MEQQSREFVVNIDSNSDPLRQVSENNKNTFVKHITRKPSRRHESGLSLSDDNDSLGSDSNSTSRTNDAFINDNQEIQTNNILETVKEPSPSVSTGRKQGLKKQLSSDNGFISQYVDGKRCEISLNRENFTYELSMTSSNSGNSRKEIALKCILAIVLCKCSKYHCKGLQFCVCCFPTTEPNLNKSNNPVVKVYYVDEDPKKGLKLNVIVLSGSHDPSVIPPEENNNQNAETLIAIYDRIHTQLEKFDRPHSMKVFINPFGGKKKANKVFDKQVEGLLRLAGVKYSHESTNKKNHAFETITDPKFDPNEFDAIIGVGGDGLFNEILNGFLARTQSDLNDIDIELEKSKIKLGIIPAGSTDAIAICTSGFRNPIHSTLSILLGHNIPIDVTSIHNRDDGKFIRFSSCFIGYGFMGDTLLASEKNRSLGPLRYLLAGISSFFKKKHYSCDINLHLDPDDGQPEDKRKCMRGCPDCHRATIKLLKQKKNKQEHDRNESQVCRRIKGGSYLGINAASMPGRCKTSKHGIAPNAHLGNGAVDLILVKNCSYLEFFRFLWHTFFSETKQFKINCVSTYRVRRFEIIPVVEPLKRGRRNSSRLRDDAEQFGAHNDSELDSQHDARFSVHNCDGELVKTAAIICNVHCQAILVYGAGYPSYL